MGHLKWEFRKKLEMDRQRLKLKSEPLGTLLCPARRLRRKLMSIILYISIFDRGALCVYVPQATMILAERMEMRTRREP